MKDERRKVRLNNKHPKEDASTFTLTRQRRRFPFFSWLHPLFFFSQLRVLLSFLSSAISISPLSFHVLSPLCCVPVSLFPTPRATVSDPDTFVSLPLCQNFKRRAGVQVILTCPGASAAATSQVYVSQRVLDDTLSLSPFLLLFD